MKTEPILQAEGVTKVFPGPGGTVPVINHLSLSVAAGEFVAVRGSSGCGKSTLLLMLGAMLRPDHGRVRVCGEDVYALSGRDRAALRAARIGFVFQRFHLVPYLDALDNLLLPSMALPVLKETENRAVELLERFGLTHRSRHRPDQLSIGERQRLALARALLNRPSVLLADEPTGNLDPDNAGIVVEALTGFAQAGGAVLLVTHDPVMAAASDRIVLLESKPRRI